MILQSLRKQAWALGDTEISTEPTSSASLTISASTVNSVYRSVCAMMGFASSLIQADTCSGLPTVALNPTLCIGAPVRCSNLIKPRFNCQPRSLAAKSCTSSITTAFTVEIIFLTFFPVNNNCRVSGVVISIFGGLRTCFALSDCVVSPCLTPILKPTDSHNSCNLLSTSLFNALRGVTYRIDKPSQFSFKHLLSRGKTAVIVFPEPVGAITSLSSPSCISGSAAC